MIENWKRLIVVALIALVAGCHHLPPPEEEEDAPENGDAILLADLQSVARGFSPAGPTLTARPTVSVSANVVYASARNGLERVGRHCLVFEGVTSWTSERGLTPIALSSRRQRATARFEGSRYRLGGLRPGSAFSTTGDKLTVSVSGGPSVAVDAPASKRVTFGKVDGFRTEYRVQGAGFDAYYVFGSGRKAGVAGESGIMCTVPKSAMKVAGSTHTTPLLPDDAIAALEKRGIALQQLYPAHIRQKQTRAFFPGLSRTVPVQAARMYKISVALLGR